MDIERLMNDLKTSPDMIPDQYDGSYELIRSIIEEYGKMSDYDRISYLDLNAVYSMAIGTWKMSIEKKKEYISKTCLPDDSKERLYKVCDQVWDNACRKQYQHTRETDVGLKDDGKPIIGMFGTGFYSFHNASEEESRRFIKLCVDILNSDNDDEIFKLAEDALSENINGMAAGSASVILHCLKPYTFPIINGNFIGTTIYPLLGVQLKKANSLGSFIDNCRKIKQFRDSNFQRINYRVFDAFSLHLDEYNDNHINIDKLKNAIISYKRQFNRIKEEETYKWIAINYFQEHFNPDAEDFRAMLTLALKKEVNLLSGPHYSAKAGILKLAEYEPEFVRTMFKDLFDENVPVIQRIKAFRQSAVECNERHNPESSGADQSYRAITTYLFFMYPFKYSMYMPSKFSKVAEFLEYEIFSDYGAIGRVEEYFDMTEQIYDYIKTDSELVNLNRSRLNVNCYQDPVNHVLAEDLNWFIFRQYEDGLLPIDEDNDLDENDNSEQSDEVSDYWPSYKEYPINITADEWKKYIQEVELSEHVEPMKMLKAMMELGGEASPKQLSETYGGSPSKYVGCTTAIGKRALKYFNLSPCKDGDVERVFPIPFQGHIAEWNGGKYYTYRIRPELQAALKGIDLSLIDPYSKIPAKTEGERYWLYSPGEQAVMWNDCVRDGVMLIGWEELGDLSEYDSREAITTRMKEVYGEDKKYWMDSAATWQFSHVIRPGDIIYAKRGRYKLVGRGVVTSEYYYDQERGEYPNVLDVNRSR